MAGLLKESLVYDDAEALVAVADGVGEAVAVGEVKGFGGHLVPDVGAGEIVAVLAPGCNGALIADLEHGGSFALVHLGGEGLFIGTGGCGDDLYGNAGLCGVGGGELLPCLVCFGLEVEVVDGALGCGGFGCGCGRGSGCGGCCGSRGLAAGAQGKYHDQCEQHCDDLFHFRDLLN